MVCDPRDLCALASPAPLKADGTDCSLKNRNGPGPHNPPSLAAVAQVQALSDRGVQTAEEL